jgi:hypothetical protein
MSSAHMNAKPVCSLKNINFIMKTVDPCRTNKVFQLLLTNDNKPSD